MQQISQKGSFTIIKAIWLQRTTASTSGEPLSIKHNQMAEWTQASLRMLN